MGQGCEALRRLFGEAEAAERRIEGAESGVEALAQAQAAAEGLMGLAERLGKLAPQLSEASMEVAECSLALAARYATVPCSLLLTDVALSCTLEASRLQHSGQALLTVRREVTSSLQTLKATLDMAKLLGTVDQETFRLSLQLVTQAASRLMACMRELSGAAQDALERGRQCLSQGSAVCHARRPEAPAPELLELPAPSTSPTAPAAPPPKAPPPQAPAARQNQRLLRQLDAELRELQRKVPQSTEGLEEVKQLVAQLLAAACQAVLQEPTPQALAEHFGFVGLALAAPVDLETQLLKFLARVEPQAALQGLKNAKDSGCRP